MSPHPTRLITAIAANGVIGDGTTMGWHVPEELQFFKQTTMGGALIMGRTTCEGIGRLLPGRQTIVLSRDPKYRFPGADTATSLNAAFALAGDRPGYVAGGAQVYAEALGVVDELIISRLPFDAAGQVRFPTIPAGVFDLNSSTDHGSFTVERYTRITG